MKTWLIVGGPLVLVVAGVFMVSSGIVTFGEVSDLEVTQESIEYREGDEERSVRKQSGIKKYTNITIRMPKGLDEDWKFIFENKVKRENCEDCNDHIEIEEDVDHGPDMIQIDPPVLVLPMR